MRFFKSVLFVFLGAIIAYLVWLFFYWATPSFMKLAWYWVVVIFLVSGGILIPLIGALPGLLSICSKSRQGKQGKPCCGTCYTLYSFKIN
jgi:hypothetical protein